MSFILFLEGNKKVTGIKDDVGNPAKAAKNFNIRTFAIGVGAADESELKLIATPPFRLHNFKSFIYLKIYFT